MTKAKETIASATEKCKDVENKMKVGLSAGVVRILKTFEFLESLKFSFIHFGPWKSLKKQWHWGNESQVWTACDAEGWGLEWLPVPFHHFFMYAYCRRYWLCLTKYFRSLFGTYNRWQNCCRCFLLQEAKTHREKELKKAEEDLNKAKKKAEESTKSMKGKQQVIERD